MITCVYWKIFKQDLHFLLCAMLFHFILKHSSWAWFNIQVNISSLVETTATATAINFKCFLMTIRYQQNKFNISHTMNGYYFCCWYTHMVPCTSIVCHSEISSQHVGIMYLVNTIYSNIKNGTMRAGENSVKRCPGGRS